MQKKGVKMLSELGNHRGQLTIFIVAGIILVSTVLVYFSIKSGFVPNLIGEKPQASVNSVLNSCLEEEVKGIIDSLLTNGGYAESPPLKLNYAVEGEDREVAYLCYSYGNYEPCINQQPLLISNIENEIKTAISEDVESCFDDMISSFESQGNDVSSEYNGFDVSLEPGRVVIQTDSRVTITGSGETTTQENFKVITFTKLYELANVAIELINQETKDCSFNYRGYEIFYPDFNIEKYQTADLSDIYSIEYEKTKEKFWLAVRGCILPQF